MARTTVAIGAMAWVLAVQFFVAQVVVAAAWTEPYSLKTRVISDLGNTECGPYPRGSSVIVCSPRYALMNLSFIVVGITMALGAILSGSAFRSGWIRNLAVLLFVAAGIGVLMVGLFPENENGTYHVAGAAINFVGGNVALMLFGLSASSGASRTRFYWFSIFSVLAGIAGLAATVLFLMHRDLGLGMGGIERVAAYTTSSWQIVAGLVLWRGNIRRGV